MKKVWVTLLFLGIIFSINIFVHNSTASAATITNDTANKKVTMTGTSYTMVFDYNLKARITSFIVNGNQVLDTANGEGIYSAVNNGAWVTTKSLAASPSVSVVGSVITATLSTSVANETWTFTVSDSNVIYKLDRTYTAAISMVTHGTPTINFAENAFENIRWPGDGGSLPIGGTWLNTNQPLWLSGGASTDTTVHVAKEQISFVMLNGTTSTALKITGTSNHSGVSRGQATEMNRIDNTSKNLRMSILTAASDLAYYAGSSIGYSSGGCTGHVRCDGGSVFNSVSAANAQLDSVTLTFTPETYASYYNIGTLNGVDQEAISNMINNYARFMIQDTKRGASTEVSIASSEVPPLEMHWIGQLLELFPEANAISAFKYGLQDIRDYLVGTGGSAGKILCCRPATGVYWGDNYRDQAAGYALGVTKAYILDGNSTWLTGMKTSVENGLDYVINNYTDSTTRLVTTDCSSDVLLNLYCNNYWEYSSGKHDGYASVLLYDALVQWANLERNVLSNIVKASYYEGIAATIKTSFNKDFAFGGFWSPYTNSFYYGDGNSDAVHLATNAEVIKSGIATSARTKLIVESVEYQAYSNNSDVHALNYLHLFADNTPAPANSNLGENGGWYGVVDGDFYSGLPLIKDPLKIPTYLSSFTNRYRADGFYNMSGATYRANIFQNFGGGWFPTTVMPVWGLYHSAYGFQPEYNRLVISPYISPAMLGSIVNYTWRNQPMTVTYNSQRSFTIASASLPTNIDVRWINQTPSTVYQVSVDGGAATNVTSDSNGIVTATMSTSGIHTYDCTNCVIVTPASGGTSLVNAVNINSATIRNNVNGNVGFKFTVGASNITINELGRYFLTGNKLMHTVKIFDADRMILGATSIDMSKGSADSLGFKYAGLTTPITLSANKTYYIESTEVVGGDTWYDLQVSLTPTSAANVNSATSGAVSFGAAGNSYGPLNFKYSISAVDSQSPSAPTALLSPWNTDSSIYLSWTPSTDNVAVTGYDVFDGGVKINTQNISGTTFNATGLMPFTSHSFTVKAKDAAGLVSNASNVVSVTTNYASTKIKEDDMNGSVTYSGSWTNSSSMDNYYLGTGHYTNAAASFSQFTFTGTSIEVVGVKNTGQGKADVYIDGVFDSTIDLYIPGYELQSVIYAKTGMVYSSHTIKIVLRSDKNPSSTGYYMSIDAFIYDSGVIARIDDSAAGITYSGAWSSGAVAGYYNGTAHWSNTAANYMQYTFTGTWVNVFGQTNSAHGKADVYIDGVLDLTIDTYTPGVVAQALIYSKAGLSNASHTVKVVIRSDKNAASTDFTTDIDALEYGSSLTNLTDDTDANANMIYSGAWATNTITGYYNKTVHYSNTATDYVQYTFSGTSIKVIGQKNNTHGKADVYVDGIFDSTIDTYSASVMEQAVIYSKTGLSNTIHTIKITLRSDKNASSVGYYTDIDAFGPVTTKWDDYASGISYSGSWSKGATAGYFNNTVHWSSTATDSVQLRFTGTAINVMGQKNNTHGKADIFIDGVWDSTIDTYSASTVSQAIIYTKAGLINAAHTVKIVLRNDKNAASTGYYTDVDAFEITN